MYVQPQTIIREIPDGPENTNEQFLRKTVSNKPLDLDQAKPLDSPIRNSYSGMLSQTPNTNSRIGVTRNYDSVRSTGADMNLTGDVNRLSYQGLSKLEHYERFKERVSHNENESVYESRPISLNLKASNVNISELNIEELNNEILSLRSNYAISMLYCDFLLIDREKYKDLYTKSLEDMKISDTCESLQKELDKFRNWYGIALSEKDKFRHEKDELKHDLLELKEEKDKLKEERDY